MPASRTLRALLATFLVGVSLAVVGLAAPPPGHEQRMGEFGRQARAAAPLRSAIPDTLSGRKLGVVLGAINGDDIDAPQHFSPDFLEYITADEIEQELASVGEAYGGDRVYPCEIDALEDRPDTLTATITSSRGQLFLNVFLLVNEDTGLITALRIDQSRDPAAGGGGGGGASGTWGEFSGDLDDLPGEVGFGAWALVPSNVEESAYELIPIAGQNEHQLMAVGSSFKLWVAGALAESILAGQQGEHRWDATLSVQDALKSLPSGRLQLKPQGTLVSLADAARGMIAISDNTATDHLIAYLGRERVESFVAGVHTLPGKNQPLLTTREAFVLKLTSDEALIEDYLAGNVEDRREMLASRIAPLAPDLAAADEWNAPRLIHDLEWFASAHDMARTFARLRALERADTSGTLASILRANPGLKLDAGIWKSAAFKGGSEPGVLHSAWMVERSDGRWFVFSLAWNNTKELIDQQRFLELAHEGIEILARDGVPEGEALPTLPQSPVDAPQRTPTPAESDTPADPTRPRVPVRPT